MLESSFRNLVAAKRLPDPLVVQLRRFTTSLIEQRLRRSDSAPETAATYEFWAVVGTKRARSHQS